MHPFLKPLISLYAMHSDKVYKEGIEKYMLHQFVYFGVRTPNRRLIHQNYFKQFPLTDFSNEIEQIVNDCYEQPEREYQYLAIELMHFYKKQIADTHIDFIEFMITQKSWWDTVDFISSDICDYYFKQYPNRIEAVTSNWNESNNTWLIRSAIIFQKKYRLNTNTQLLAKYILNHTNSKEFFIQKAMGWALREYAKHNPSWVLQFVHEHDLVLPKLTKREALKHLR